MIFPMVSEASPSLHDQINTARSGDVIYLQSNAQSEPITIDQPIHIKGNGMTITYEGTKPLITIKSDNVIIEDLHVDYTYEGDEAAPAILLTGDAHTLNRIHIQTNNYGIQLNESNDNTLSHINVTGDQTLPIRDRQHGIDLWESHRNTITHSHVRSVKDGIYIEKSNDNILKHNVAHESRYGYHLMFTKFTQLKHNETYENISGMMIMGTEGTTATHNTITNNQQDLQSLGLLLFDVTGAVITNNTITNNRIGIFIEQAHHNELTQNHVLENYVGLQFKQAEDNIISQNAFIANVVQGQAEDSAHNKTNANFWSDHVGLDTTGDGLSNVPYEVDPFYLILSNEYPTFQLLFQSPGMVFLENLIHIPKDERLIDHTPLLERPNKGEAPFSPDRHAVLAFSLSLLFISSLIIYMGVKKE